MASTHCREYEAPPGALAPLKQLPRIEEQYLYNLKPVKGLLSLVPFGGLFLSSFQDARILNILLRYLSLRERLSGSPGV